MATVKISGPFFSVNCLCCCTSLMYRGADKSLARPTSRCILFDVENIWFDASLVIYRVSQEECARLRESVPYVKVYRYNPKYLYPKLNGYGDNGQRKVWSSCGCTHCTCQLARPCVGCHVTEFLLTVARSQDLLECS